MRFAVQATMIPAMHRRMHGSLYRFQQCEPQEKEMNKRKETAPKISEEMKAEKAKPQDKRDWETPSLEDVSEQVMAQPYIRFT